MVQFNHNRFFREKKGDATPTSSTGASTVIILITLLLVLYLILIPPEYRSALLNGDNISDSSYSATSLNKVLLEKNPGYWSFNSLDSFEHDLLAFNLLSKTNAKLLKKQNYLRSYRSLFSKDIAAFNFTINSLSEIDNLYLNYKISELNGVIDVVLNGYTIKKITNSDESSIKLNELYLKEGLNKIQFVPEEIKFAFWDSNSITFNELNLYGDVIDLSNLKNSQTFWISHDEMLNVEDASLRFYVGCKDDNSGILKISLNNQNIFSGLPDCDMLNVINHLNINLLREGSNNLEFSSNQGSFAIDNVLLKTQLRKSQYPTYFFQISDDDYKLIQDGSSNVSLSVIFSNSDDYKELEIILNGHAISINTYSRDSIKYINPMDIKDGNNVLEIKPKTSINIAELKLVAN